MATSKPHNASISSLIATLLAKSDADGTPLQHDIVLDYVNHHALAQTARVLSRPKGSYHPGPGGQNGHASTSRDAAMTDIAEEREDGDGRNGANGTEGADGMDVDISTQSAASGSGSHEKTFSQSELASIEHRRAVEALNIHFPYVLDDTNPASDYQSARSSYDTQASIVNWNNASMPSSSNHASPVGLQSTLPAHVKLNLQIQQFIESFRQLGRSSPSSPSSSISSMTSSMHMSISGHLPSNGNGNGNGVSNGKAPHDGSRAHSSTAALTAALTAAQGLHAEAKKLPSDIRAVYLQEIKDVGALFAYTDPETSILKGFLDQSRRVALAGQVNRAILSSEGRGSVAILQEMAQRTTAIYNVLGEKGVDVRPTTAELSRDQLSQYWKHQGSSQFRLHDFVEQSWN